ncbi:histidinol dehydrogenase [Balneola sp. MJW-20]|uniref:histidinol dehydrogenase n=1 Tax=Gracilimonas aurantiaca TaxID=3234185 RepID=UPI003465AE9D
MKYYNQNDIKPDQRAALLKRPKIDFSSIFSTVQPIIDAVEAEGDPAVLRFTEKFDGVNPGTTVLDPKSMEVELDSESRLAIDTAFDNIFRFHKAQLPNPIEVETMPGVRCMKTNRAIPRVGLYVPGGTAVLPSSAMMLSIPALIAGCETTVMATPPRKDGSIAPELIYIAQKAGVDQILLAGGAQAVAAMAFGTQSVYKVDKILGPGNQYVTAAKMILQNSEAQISIDMPAGPSEVLVIADDKADPSYVAADLLSQAEHGTDSQVVLLATAGFDWDQLESELEEQLNDLPRKEMAEGALKNSYCITMESLDDAFEFSNDYAPEHLILNIENAEDHMDRIQNAGSVFLGALTPESVGDYASGTNHTLPTYGYARMYSGVNLSTFMKSVTFQSLSKEGLVNLGSTVETLAEIEGLHAHRNAVSIRLKDLNSQNKGVE